MPNRSYYLPDKQLEELTKLGAREGVSNSTLVRRAVALYLAVDKHIVNNSVVINGETYVLVT